jgi:ribosomal protein S18 acetylase RimI-like enzyme
VSAPTLRLPLPADDNALLALEGLAGAAGHGFIYDDAVQSRAFRAWLLGRGVADFAPPWARLLELDGRVAGLLCMLPGRELARRRLLAALALQRAGGAQLPEHVRARLSLLGTTLVRCQADDAYLSSIAVDPAFAGCGLGSWMLTRAIEEARQAGASRLVLEVDRDNGRAQALYARHGFREVGRGEAVDATGTRRVCNIHLALDVGGAGVVARQP